jgi:hypothetical protein
MRLNLQWNCSKLSFSIFILFRIYLTKKLKISPIPMCQYQIRPRNYITEKGSIHVKSYSRQNNRRILINFWDKYYSLVLKLIAFSSMKLITADGSFWFNSSFYLIESPFFDDFFGVFLTGFIIHRQSPKISFSVSLAFS